MKEIDGVETIVVTENLKYPFSRSMFQYGKEYKLFGTDSIEETFYAALLETDSNRLLCALDHVGWNGITLLVAFFQLRPHNEIVAIVKHDNSSESNTYMRLTDVVIYFRHADEVEAMALDALFDGLSDPVELTRFDPSAPGSRGENFQSEVNAITEFKKELVSSINCQRQEENQKMNVRHAYC